MNKCDFFALIVLSSIFAFLMFIVVLGDNNHVWLWNSAWLTALVFSAITFAVVFIGAIMGRVLFGDAE